MKLDKKTSLEDFEWREIEECREILVNWVKEYFKKNIKSENYDMRLCCDIPGFEIRKKDGSSGYFFAKSYKGIIDKAKIVYLDFGMKINETFIDSKPDFSGFSWKRKAYRMEDSE